MQGDQNNHGDEAEPDRLPANSDHEADRNELAEHNQALQAAHERERLLNERARQAIEAGLVLEALKQEVPLLNERTRQAIEVVTSDAAMAVPASSKTCARFGRPSVTVVFTA